MYTEQMRKAIRTIKVPNDFKMDIVDYSTFLTIQFYESQWRHYSETERIRCIEYVTKIKKILEKCGALVSIDPILDINPEDYKKQKRRR
jgi:hypothetical protein